MQRCPNGHPAVDPGARFCLQCGAQVGDAPPAPLASCGVHPDQPARLPCPRCGTFACDLCLVRQPDGTERCARCHARHDSQLAWDQRAELGTARAFWRTTTAMMTRPLQTLAMASPSAGVGSSLWLAILANLIASITTVGLYVLLGIVAVASSDNLDPLKTVLIALAIVVGAAVAVVGIAAGGTVANAALDHLILRLSGAKARSFEVTLKASALSLSPAWVALIPFCGFYGYAVWALVLRVLAYRQLHQISGGRAALAALAIPGLLILLVMTFYLIALGSAFAQLPGPTD